jgi:glycosyltransferase involved in cell wall biosynthesis
MKKKSPKVSIIMNCYNGEKFLFESIESVINQTYKNWELIFFDNKSKDKSKKIFFSFKDRRLKYFCGKKHTSLYQARNAAIRKASGSYIAFIDTDDLWVNKKIELQINLLKDPEVGLVYSNFYLLKNNTGQIKKFSRHFLPSGYIFKNITENYNIGIVTTVIKKKFFYKLKKKFNNKYNHVGDMDLFIRLSKICKFSALQEPLAYVRLHGTNLSFLKKTDEIKELKYWKNNNRKFLSKKSLDFFNKRILNIDFINSKLENKFLRCLKLILFSNPNIINLKNIIILVAPNFLLKKVMWF